MYNGGEGTPHGYHVRRFEDGVRSLNFACQTRRRLLISGLSVRVRRGSPLLPVGAGGDPAPTCCVWPWLSSSRKNAELAAYFRDTSYSHQLHSAFAPPVHMGRILSPRPSQSCHTWSAPSQHSLCKSFTCASRPFTQHMRSEHKVAGAMRVADTRHTRYQLPGLRAAHLSSAPTPAPTREDSYGQHIALYHQLNRRGRLAQFSSTGNGAPSSRSTHSTNAAITSPARPTRATHQGVP